MTDILQANKGAGDPAGRKLARRRAIQAEEACRIAEVLARQMRWCGVSDTEAISIAESLRQYSVDCFQKAHGRVESRITTRKTGHPLLKNRRLIHLYLDESGVSGMKGADSVFALGGVALLDEDIKEYIQRANDLKYMFFGRIDFPFHEPKMRRHNEIYYFNGNIETQSRFDAELRTLIKNTPFICFGVGVRKDVYKRLFIDTKIDPYLPLNIYSLALTLLLERFIDYISTHIERRIGRIHLESIGAKEDAEHQAVFADLLLHGTQFVSDSVFQSWMEAGCRFSPKGGSNPSELADIVAREIFEWTRSDCKVEPIYWSSLNDKIHLRADGHFGKFGVKVFPSEDIEEDLISHREHCKILKAP